MLVLGRSRFWVVVEGWIRGFRSVAQHQACCPTGVLLPPMRTIGYHPNYPACVYARASIVTGLYRSY